MNKDGAHSTEAPESLQKGLLQLLWTTKPWVRNAVLVVGGVVLLLVALVPQDVRYDLVRRVLGAGGSKDHAAAPAVPQAIPLLLGPVATLPAIDDENPHVMRLKNGHLVRLVGSIVRNDSNVEDSVIIGDIENNAWRYNEYCLERPFGHLKTPPPAGKAKIAFDILDQLPQHIKLEASTFQSDSVARCLVEILTGQTMNASGSNGEGRVVYELKVISE